jgi:hypothetical protein
MDRREHRAELLEAVARFVEGASRCRGVLRIALVGSLTTEKPNPHDADVLVTVEDDADLKPLARLGRKLKGSAQSLNLGADIFLTDSHREYIGRICHWRECGPGIRAACRADHCGRRAHLYDDLRVFKLDSGLAKSPPIELWPEIERRVPVPDDVETLLITRCLKLIGERTR